MKYIEMNIETSSAGIEALITALMEVGITDVVVEDPRDFEELMDKKQSYDWDYVEDELINKMNDVPKNDHLSLRNDARRTQSCTQYTNLQG